MQAALVEQTDAANILPFVPHSITWLILNVLNPLHSPQPLGQAVPTGRCFQYIGGANVSFGFQAGFEKGRSLPEITKYLMENGSDEFMYTSRICHGMRSCYSDDLSSARQTAVV